MAENNSKDVASSLSKISDTSNKGTNLLLNGSDAINKWYAEQLTEMVDGEVPNVRLETNAENTQFSSELSGKEHISKIETKVGKYTEIQTNNKMKSNNFKLKGRLQTQNLSNKTNIEITNDNITQNKKERIIKNSKRISTTIKGAKSVNNTINKLTRTGKSLNTAINEGGLKSFENNSSRIMTKPVKKVTKKATGKLKTTTKKVAKKGTKKIAKKTGNALEKTLKVIEKIVEATVRLFLTMLPALSPIIIILLAVALFCSFFGIGMSEDTKKGYEAYMLATQEKYDKETIEFYNEGKIVDGAIEGKGMINWKASLSILQMLNGDLSLDLAELEMLDTFDKAGLFEKITEEEYTYDKEVTTTDEEGNETTTTEKVTETKKIVTYASLDDCIEWCNKHFDKINKYKKKKKLEYDSKQKKFTDEEIEQIKLLYKSNYFFDLFSSKLRDRYSYFAVNITDEQLQLIYDEFLRNIGKRYVLDHSNLDYDNCMDYYDCSSWTIHCLAHTGIKKIPNTGASGIFKDYCQKVEVDDRQAGDLIFLKNTYGDFPPGEITHVGIYMGELTINGETDEWIIDTGGNPTGVKIRKYKNGWWNGEHFSTFGRLKE